MPNEGQPPRPIIMRFHSYLEQDRVLNAARKRYREKREMKWQGNNISFFPDMTKEVVEKRQKFSDIRKKLNEMDVRFTLAYPADTLFIERTQGQDLQHVLERFAAECEAAGMRISTSKSEAMVLDRKRVACPLRVGGGGEVLPQVEEFKWRSLREYLGVLFTSEGKMEREIDRRMDWCSVRSYVVKMCTGPSGGEEGAELKGEALSIYHRSIYAPTLPYLWS
ncbi:hypothetical protein L3Q82_007063 [Scortum barcoo]|uniref:Uncharacterized protein n=1 Tax=Scortum barcoo TaxID=214431 RepID=A0ACB8WWR2_9TELE|nr:hypothetical protein L3Q82_007063 [Scortum barcoo]